MSVLSDALFVTTPKEFSYLLDTYCKENSYLTLNDLKQKHREYLFASIRWIRRALETQLYNINQTGIMAFQHCNRMLTVCLEYYNGLSEIEDAKTLETRCKTLQDNYQQALDDFRASI